MNTTPKARAPRKSEMKLKVNFTDKELLEIARKQSQYVQDLAQAEDEKKNVTGQLKAKCDGIASRISETSHLISNGYEYRDVTVETSFDTPKIGLKTTIRLDTGEIVNTEPMTLAEQQAELPLEERKESELTADSFDFVPEQVYPESLKDTITEEDCQGFASGFRELMLSFDGELMSESNRRAEMEIWVSKTPTGVVDSFLLWLKAERSTPIPGAAEAIAVVTAEARRLRDLALAEQAKKKAGRRRFTAGTVEVPSDDGSRDDAGSESKSNL